MTIFIPNALPSANASPALVEPFAIRYPKLAHLFNARHAKNQPWPVSDQGCTPAEGLLLLELGYEPESNATIGSGLGPLHARSTHSGQSVWVAQLCGIVITQERATVVPLDLIDARAEDIVALEHAAQSLFSPDADGILIEPLGQGLWRVHGDFPCGSKTISPLALMGQDLGDWWPTDNAWRSWRKRVNEIQMAWHNHPVNQTRESEGLPAINTIWLYGGGKGFTPNQALDQHWLDALSLFASRGDWSGWLDAWEELEPALLKAEPDREIVLTGDDRIVRLQNAPKRWWRNLFAKEQSDSWRNWWLNQN
ncbi:hypothetical protein [Orrella daihaiensis]|uniref:Cofactor-independent phosphoglycerate mutase n=1 Tax=Orrella daihaiensis TaxID=2782176 RepID=A0ABY4AGA4_9BURK|nr:hypothetical protein [Orrella daihaiensis]UOD49287.1 hypothetical protein DHf2319_07205 [Orrella daihaiensis]